MASSSLLLFRMASGAARRNRLISESSPYLLQHATNPVDWYPWGEDAFKRAVSENKPIFLSIGYSTCHWCHVMERESFNNQRIADILNNHFISVKVDREERPDVDRVYMTFIQATQGGGGWPMSVFLTPDLKPFVGGTYFPPNDSQGRPGFITLLNMIKEQWASDSGTIRLRMEKVMQILQDAVTIKPKELRLPGTACIQSTAELFDKRFDKEYGGFGEQPKFPQPIILDFLLRLHNKYGDSQMGESGLDMVMGTLKAMANGGIHDHIGQGFHRYSTDKEWHVPHFEKMLYDQSQLTTGDKIMEDTAHDILLYVTRDLCDKDGGFYSAEDADSYPAGKSPENKKEGAFCVWTWDEVMELLKDPVNDVGGAKPITMGDIVTEYYGMKPKGNVDRIKDPHGELIGQNVLIIWSSVRELALKHSVSEDQVNQAIAKAKEILSAHRQGRPKPHRDDKIVASWNGLMISALAKAARVFGDEKYLLAACKCASFIREHMYRQEDGVLLRSTYRDNKGNLIIGNIEGFADDYSCMICGLIDLYESSHTPKWLEWAVKLQEKQDELFWDKNGGGYFNSSGTDKTVLLQMKEDQDGSEPSPNSLSAMNLLRLSTIFHDPDYRSKAETIFKTFNEHLTDHPAALTGMVSAFIYYSSKPKQIIFIGDPLAEGTKGLMNVVNSFHIPNKVMVFHDPADPSPFLTGRIPMLTGMRLMDEKPTVQVCEDYQCQAPTNDPTVLKNMLKPQKII